MNKLIVISLLTSVASVLSNLPLARIRTFFKMNYNFRFTLIKIIWISELVMLETRMNQHRRTCISVE